MRPLRSLFPGNKTTSFAGTPALWGESASEVFLSAIQKEALQGVQVRPELEDFFLEEVIAECTSGKCASRPKFWKKSSRPVFEGEWFCGKECARNALEAIVRRQRMSAVSGAGGDAHKHRIPLGLVLLDRGLISSEQLQAALLAQKIAGHGRLGDWLHETCGLGSDAIAKALGAQWNRPVLSLSGFRADKMALVLPDALRKRLGVLPLRVAAGKILYLAFQDRIDHAAVAMLERMSGLRVESGFLTEESFLDAAERMTYTRSPECVEEEISSAEEVSDLVVRSLFRYQPIASRLVAVHGVWWLRMWLETAAVSEEGSLPETGEDVVDVLMSPM